MTATEKIYQSILYDLSKIPADKLPQVSAYLQQLQSHLNDKALNRDEILTFSGSWNDMAEEDFQQYLKEAKSAGEDAFSREVDL